MLLVNNQALAVYSAGTIQMVPGRAGYEPAPGEGDSGQAGLMQASRDAGYRRTMQPDETYETTYNTNRRLSSSGTSNVGSFIDIYA